MTAIKSSQELQEIREIITGLVASCLEDLVVLGFVSVVQLNRHRWCVKFDHDGRLDKNQFFAATSVDEGGRPFVLINPNLQFKSLAWSVPHEAVHLAQICKGDWLPCDGFSIWKGARVENLKADHKGYTADQPWEAEASDLESGLREKMYGKFPTFECKSTLEEHPSDDHTN